MDIICRFWGIAWIGRHLLKGGLILNLKSSHLVKSCHKANYRDETQVVMLVKFGSVAHADSYFKKHP